MELTTVSDWESIDLDKSFNVRRHFIIRDTKKSSAYIDRYCKIDLINMFCVILLDDVVCDDHFAEVIKR